MKLTFTIEGTQYEVISALHRANSLDVYIHSIVFEYDKKDLKGDDI